MKILPTDIEQILITCSVYLVFFMTKAKQIVLAAYFKTA